MKIRAVTRAFAALLSAFLLLDNEAIAKEKENYKEEIYVVFAVDHSGSMNSYDSRNLMPGILSTFAEAMQNRNISIGYVAYNDTILARYPVAPVTGEEQQSGLREVISGAQNRGETDMGMGLLEAYEMLSEVSGKKMIILISDGETDLAHSHTGRTKEDSDTDMKEIAEKCSAEKIPIVTVGFGTKQEEVRDDLRSISQQTDGKSYEIQQVDELIEVLGDIFCNNMDYVMYEAGGQARESREVLYESADAVIFNTQQGTKAYLIEKRALRPALTWEEEAARNRQTGFSIAFTDSGENPAEGLPYLKSCRWTLAFINSRTGESTETELSADGDRLTGSVTLKSSGKYLVLLRSDQIMQNTYRLSDVSITNTLPGSLSGEGIEIFTHSEPITVDLTEFFADGDGDELSFELTSFPNELTEAQLYGNLLELTPVGRGRGEISLLVCDGEGSLAGSIPVRVRSLWEAYWQVIALAVCILGFAVFKILGRVLQRTAETAAPKEKGDCSFTGKINAYFTLLPEGMEEIPPLNFALYTYKDKKIVMKDMFAEYPELTDVLQLDRIFLFPGQNRKMILYHDCEAAVMIGNSIACRKTQYIISYGNVIYITSGDGLCELEVHYISMI